MKFCVAVEGKRAQSFDTADEALRFAMHHVYLAPERFQDMKYLLEICQVASYAYGFSGVDIIPFEPYREEDPE